MPESDDHNIGYKFPFNSCEILQSENSFILDKMFESVEHVECEEISQRKFSNISHEGYKDDHSIDESEESADEVNMQDHDEHHEEAIAEKNFSNFEREIESKIVNCGGYVNNEKENESEENLKEKENLDINLNEDLNEMAHSNEIKNSYQNFEEKQTINDIQENEKESEKTDDEILYEIGKKIQILEIQVGTEQIVMDGHDILIENNEEDEGVANIQEVNENNMNKNDESEKANREADLEENYPNEVIDAHDILIEEQHQNDEEEEMKHEILIDEQVRQEEEENEYHEILIESSHTDEETCDNQQENTNEINLEEKKANYEELHEESHSIAVKEDNYNEELVNQLPDDKADEDIEDNFYTTNLDNNQSSGSSDVLEESERLVEEPKEEEEKDPSKNVRHKVIPRHKKHHSKRHEFFTEEGDIFNISEENIQDVPNHDPPVKEVKYD
jgi:hypothetical protein